MPGKTATSTSLPGCAVLRAWDPKRITQATSSCRAIVARCWESCVITWHEFNARVRRACIGGGLGRTHRPASGLDALAVSLAWPLRPGERGRGYRTMERGVFAGPVYDEQGHASMGPWISHHGKGIQDRPNNQAPQLDSFRAPHRPPCSIAVRPPPLPCRLPAEHRTISGKDRSCECPPGSAHPRGARRTTDCSPFYHILLSKYELFYKITLPLGRLAIGRPIVSKRVLFSPAGPRSTSITWSSRWLITS